MTESVMVNVISTNPVMEKVAGKSLCFQEVCQKEYCLRLHFNLTCRDLYDQLAIHLQKRSTDLDLIVYSRCDRKSFVVRPEDTVNILAPYLSNRFYLLCFIVRTSPQSHS